VHLVHPLRYTSPQSAKVPGQVVPGKAAWPLREPLRGGVFLSSYAIMRFS